MNYQLISSLSPITSECLILGIFSDDQKQLDQAHLHHDTQKLIQRMNQKTSKPGDYQWQSDHQDHAILLVNCGQKKDYKTSKMLHYLGTAIKQVLGQNYSSVSISFPQIQENDDVAAQLKSMVLKISFECYLQPQYKTEFTPHALNNVKILWPKSTETQLQQAVVIAQAVEHARYLADCPANHLTPTILAEKATKLSQEVSNLSCKVHDLKAIRALKMGGLLAVSQGSIEAPTFIEMEYQGSSSAQAPIVLVGKGITFDAGGISLKPPAHMNEMKYDMCGAASVIATLWACAQLQLPLHVIGLIPAAENLPSGSAIKPGDIITMMSGKTIEVVNTDAEGRLILADALTYAERFKPERVIDLATLTGAVIIALGGEYTGLMSPHEELAHDLLKAAARSHDKLWRLPLDEAYDVHLESPIADMMNAHFDRSAGSIVAGMFLAQFTKNYQWAHLDIAGTAWISGSKRVSTGRPVPLLMEFLHHACQKS